jgi:tRNA A37 threonylcarbamoyladenosine biosynthesis protein TsaE
MMLDYWDQSSTFPTQKTDPVVDRVIKQFSERSRIGIDKYGKTLSENPLSLLEWLEHLKQELMDATLYIERAKDEVKSKQNNNK